ncbi:hypothetical protein J5N97_022853 [Dioscorea zingiberensis]|uniref:Uncharacterized protein n=1 Tax=Dioscorea zingiberensis TaxID=325984 RepID=A0A9D5HAY7_9LILI|nr:hypothetical protein J5N97_022853 [Dioscorea zingiberensis]
MTTMAMLEVLFMRQNSLKSLLYSVRGRRSSSDGDEDPIPIPQLSPIANSVVSRCSRILVLSTKELQQCFQNELPDSVKQPATYARHLLEFCSYKALHVLTKCPDYLADKEFHRLTFDMMLAWEAPATGSESLPKGTACDNHPEVEDEDGGSRFYTNSTSMAVQVDDKKNVGLEAFTRIASACPAVADVITVQNLFMHLQALHLANNIFLYTASTSKALTSMFLFPKYTDWVLKSAKGLIGPSFTSSLQLADGEVILDIDGVMPTQPVPQHVGISAWPGRLTLTNHALYFESLGVGSYDKPARYDLVTDLKQVIKREMTGPLGARLFDKAVMYKSTPCNTEPIFLELPEFKGHTRRDYWLEIIREVLNVHRFIKKFNLKEIQREEVLSMANLGIFRYRGVKEAFHMAPTHFKSTLAFNLTEKLPKGDIILEALYTQLLLLRTGYQRYNAESLSNKSPTALLPASLLALSRMGLMLLKKPYMIEEKDFPEWVVRVESICHSGRVEAACATLDQVKVEGIDTNLAVMQALLYPLVESGKWLRFLSRWEDPFKSIMFLIVSLYVVYRGWIRFILPCIFLSLAIMMLWNKYRGKGKPLEGCQVTPPPNKNAVEQLFILQDAISHLETYVQAGNIFLLKLRALLFGATPQAIDLVALYLIAMAAVFAFVPFKHLLALAFLEMFIREMPLRKYTSDRFLRRMREWWVCIPVAPVQLLRSEENKRK